MKSLHTLEPWNHFSLEQAAVTVTRSIDGGMYHHYPWAKALKSGPSGNPRKRLARWAIRLPDWYNSWDRCYLYIFRCPSAPHRSLGHTANNDHALVHHEGPHFNLSPHHRAHIQLVYLGRVHASKFLFWFKSINRAQQGMRSDTRRLIHYCILLFTQQHPCTLQVRSYTCSLLSQTLGPRRYVTTKPRSIRSLSSVSLNRARYLGRRRYSRLLSSWYPTIHSWPMTAVNCL
jgi:hypothetical protein